MRGWTIAAAGAALTAIMTVTGCGTGTPAWCPALGRAVHAQLTPGQRTRLLNDAARRYHVPALARLAHAASEMFYWQAQENGTGAGSFNAVTQAANWARRSNLIERPLDRSCHFPPPRQ